MDFLGIGLGEVLALLLIGVPIAAVGVAVCKLAFRGPGKR